MSSLNFTNIIDKIKSDPVVGDCATKLSAQQLLEAENGAHLETLAAISSKMGHYFRLFKVFKRGRSAILKKIKADEEITLEGLVGLGFRAGGEFNAKHFKDGKYEQVTSQELLKSFGEDINDRADLAKNVSFGEIIEKLNDYAYLGARILGAHQNLQQRVEPGGTDLRKSASIIGMPTLYRGPASRPTDEDKKVLKGIKKLINERNSTVVGQLAVDNNSETKIRQDKFKFALFKSIQDLLESNIGKMFLFYTNPNQTAPLSAGTSLFESIHAPLYLSPSRGKVTSEDVSAKTKAFIKEILNVKLVVSDKKVEKTYKELFQERFLVRCRAFISGDVETTEDKFPQINSELELKRKRLQNVRCVLPLFEDLYSSSNIATFTDSGMTGVYSKNYKHTLNSLGLKSASSKKKFFTSQHHPLIFAYTKDSHFFVNKLFNKGDSRSTLKSFLEATNTDISFLQPRIRVYKVFETQEGKEQEIPIEFSNKIELTKSSGVYERENAGIERVRIRRTGQTPATFDKLIDVNIRLIFDSINAFTKCRTTSIGKKKYSYVDLLRRPVELKQTDKQIGDVKRGASELERFGSKELEKFIDKAQEINIDSYSPDKFQIKLEVGWSFNDQVFQNQTAASKRARLEKFISETNLVMYLTLQTHDFTFRNDGTVSLDVRYMGRAGGQLIDAFQTNIFHTPNLGRLSKAVTVVDDILRFSADNKDFSVNRNVMQQRKNQLVHKLNTERSNLTSQVWKRLVDASVDPNNSNGSTLLSSASGNEAPTHFLRLNVPKSFLFFDAEFFTKLGVKTDESTTDKLKETASSRVTNTDLLLSYYRNKFLEGSASETDNLKLEVVAKKDSPTSAEGTNKNLKGEDAIKDPDLAQDPLRPEDFEEQLDDGTFDSQVFKNTYLTIPGGGDKKTSMYCLRYGSVVHSAIQNIWQFNPEGLKDIVVILASSRFESISGGVRHFNFADIPILFEDWKRFMIDKVVNKKKVNYALIDFIRDSMMELLIPAMGAINTGCKDGTQIASPLKAVKPRLTSFSARRQQGLSPNDGSISVSLDKKEAALLVGNKLIGNENIVDGKEHLKHFLVIYDAGFSTAASLEKGRKPKLYDTNLKHNIPHVFIGANRGIMRSVSFRKSTVPFLQESKVLDRGDTDFGLLREKYDVTLETVGNPHFHQGMRFYLDPTFTGMSSHNIDVVQGVLGLGGYYDIVDVTSDISNSGFKTSIVGSWQAFHEGYDSKKRHVDPCKDK